MTILKIMNTDEAAFSLTTYQRRWTHIKSNVGDMFEHWNQLSNTHLKEVLELTQYDQQKLKISGSVIDKAFQISLSPTIVNDTFVGKLSVYSPDLGNQEYNLLAEYLIDRDHNISTHEDGPTIDQNETRHPNYTLLINILTEVLKN